jgi:hypothetical protein
MKPTPGLTYYDVDYPESRWRVEGETSIGVVVVKRIKPDDGRYFTYAPGVWADCWQKGYLREALDNEARRAAAKLPLDEEIRKMRANYAHRLRKEALGLQTEATHKIANAKRIEETWGLPLQNPHIVAPDLRSFNPEMGRWE